MVYIYYKNDAFFDEETQSTFDKYVRIYGVGNVKLRNDKHAKLWIKRNDSLICTAVVLLTNNKELSDFYYENRLKFGRAVKICHK